MGGRCAAGVAVAVAITLGGCAHEISRRIDATPESTPAASSGSRERTMFAEAIVLADRGEDEAARARFGILLETYPALEDYHLAWLAELAERARRFSEAASFDERLIGAHPDSVWIARALSRRARVALALGDPRASYFADRTLEVAAHDKESRGYALLVQADVQAAQFPAEAYALYQRVRELSGTPAALARDRAATLERTAPELLDDPDLLLKEGRVLMREGRLDLAAARLHAAAAAGNVEERSAALRALARTYQLQGRIDEAIATYREAAGVEGGHGMAAFELASLLWNRDHDDEAHAMFARLLREAPGHPKRDSARYALARIAERRGDDASAVTYYRGIVDARSDADLVRDARWRLAWLPYRRGDYAKAAEAFAELASASDLDRAAGWYWQGRARAHAGDMAAATASFATVVAEAPETYYADLAEQRLGVAAPPPPAPAHLTGAPPPALTLRSYHWTRAEELREAGLDHLAVRELDALARELADSEPRLLEQYRRVDAPNRALGLAARLEKQAVLPPATLAPYLYPRGYWVPVEGAASAARLDPYLVLALIRQESLFDPDAISAAAAFGLMQLLGRTASRVAGREVPAAELADPATNVALGTRYLRQLLDRYDGNAAKALAAYNAGEDAVAKWERRFPDLDLDEFVESITYRETRRYVKVVLGNYRRYRRLYGAPGERRALDFAAAVTPDE